MVTRGRHTQQEKEPRLSGTDTGKQEVAQADERVAVDQGDETTSRRAAPMATKTQEERPLDTTARDEGGNVEREDREEQETGEKTDSISDKLLSAVREVTAEIEKCDSIIEKAEARKEELQAELRQTMKKLNQQFGLQVSERVTNVSHRSTPKRTQTRQKPRQQQSQRPLRKGRGGHEKSIRQLILEYLQENREARTSEIRQFLEDEGRPTNPGVELSRMVKDGSIINRERGLYVLAGRNR